MFFGGCENVWKPVKNKRIKDFIFRVIFSFPLKFNVFIL